MSKELEITKEYGKNSWGLKGLTLEELRALYEAVRTANLPAAPKPSRRERDFRRNIQ